MSEIRITAADKRSARKFGSMGGKKSRDSMTPEQRIAAARKAAQARWEGAVQPYKEYFIEVRVRDNDGAFTGYGFIRKPCPVGAGLPFETSFDSSERYPTEKAAREAGLAFAKRKIDGR
jgi:hypothetical protein